MAQEQVEEYLEAIYDIAGTDGAAKTTAIAKCLKVAPASVTEALQSLAEKNLVNYEPYRGASLTGEGKKIAETIKRRHRLLEVFLADVLHINRAKVHDEACRMEHTISEDTENALCRMLNAPARCPHGSPILPCAKGVGSCSECDAVTGSGLPFPEEIRSAAIIPVTDLEPHQKGTIAFIRGDCRVVQRLSDLGLTLGTAVSVTRKAPLNGPVEVSVRRTKLAIDHAIAENIFVDATQGDRA
ncbi:metal-dependent transcriptional regulator [Methanoregula sp.]|uniref:metal-dependent transcriptional regulator n=1 Tax=Methanoregula sp. TaxID=2052170 RepID=UPI002C4B57C9|nr:metal-dependent transcriptional regulator [Methanoregula sp.]HVP97336.1 metal-dependent transcriptional regulator [Methanoregula sp.]